MKRTALIAALVSVIPLLGAGASAEAQGYGRGYGHGHGYGHGYGRPPIYRPAPPVVVVRPPHHGHFYHRPHWRPRPWWNRPHYWR